MRNQATRLLSVRSVAPDALPRSILQARKIFECTVPRRKAKEHDIAMRLTVFPDLVKYVRRSSAEAEAALATHETQSR